MLGEANPELIVDETGTIVKLVNVVVTDELGTVYGLGSTIPAGRQIWVGDLRNDRAGIARFRANDARGRARRAGSGATPGSSTTRRPGTTSGSPTRRTGPSSSTSSTWSTARRRRSSRSTPSASRARWTTRPTTSPLDEGNSLGATFEFDLTHSFPATRIEIRNTQTGTTANSDIVLAGQLSGVANGVTINNPIGTTIIDNQRGSITATGSFLLLRTNVLTLNADGGSIGTHTRSTGGVITARAPIPVELIQFVDAANALHPVTLTAEATADVVLDLRAVRREAVSATPFVVTIASLRAGNDLDLVINDSNQQQSPRDAAGRAHRRLRARGRLRHAAAVPEPAAGAERHLRRVPDLLPALPAGHGRRLHHEHRRCSRAPPTLVNSAYTFADARAGRDISIQHPSTATTISFTATTDVDTPADGDGKIDMTTNGFITVTERTRRPARRRHHVDRLRRDAHVAGAGSSTPSAATACSAATRRRPTSPA